MNFISTAQLSRELNLAPNTILTFAKENKLGGKVNEGKKNSPYIFSEAEAQKIRKHFTKRA